MTRVRLAVLAVTSCAVSALGLAFVGTRAAAGSAGGGGCQLTGTANFSPNGPGSTQSFGYSFTGTLSQCQSTISGSPAGGSIEAGQVTTETVPITEASGTVVTGSAQYQEPASTGSGLLPENSCPGGSTSGEALVTWPDGTTTVTSYSTQSVAAAVDLQGTVVPSMTLALVPGSESPAGTAPSTYTISSTSTSFPAGDSAQGLLAFTTSAPQACTTASGLSSVSISGLIGLGSTS